MKHIRFLSKPAGKAYGVGIGHYVMLAGQILGILALLFIDKPEPEETDNDTNGS